jgi:choline dehydrogenase
MLEFWDYVIVGGGSAGAVLAARLSENPAHRVLLLEAGGWDWSPRIHIPGLLNGAISSAQLNWNYRGEPDASLGGRALTWAGGRVVGGSSSINGMVYGRGLPEDYDRWTRAGNPGWGWNEMLPYFRRMEHWSGPPGQARGAHGPLAVRPFEDTESACASTMAALIALGVPRVEDYSAGIMEGVGVTQATQTGRWRHSVASAYIRPAWRRPNLTVRTHSRALRLLFEGVRCAGVRVARNGQIRDFHAAREVIVSAGAIGSPKLLLLSGVGPADELAAHGIETVHDLPGVGRNMNEHVNIKLSAFVDRKTYNTRGRGPSALGDGLRWLALGSGAATSPANHAQAFVRTWPGLASADIQIQIMPFGFGTADQMARNGLTVVVSPCHPEVRGQVSLRSADPADPPRISISLLDSETDRAKLLRGCKLAYAALREGPGRTMGGQIYAPAAEPADDAEWLTFFRDTAALNWHPTSTCRMGPGPADVVDASLRVHGLSGVSVVDASIMPSVTSGNTNAPVIAIAERAAELIADRHA